MVLAQVRHHLGRPGEDGPAREAAIQGRGGFVGHGVLRPQAGGDGQAVAVFVEKQEANQGVLHQLRGHPDDLGEPGVQTHLEVQHMADPAQ